MRYIWLEKLIRNRALYHDATGIEADLSLVEEGAERRCTDRIVHVHVVEDDH